MRCAALAVIVLLAGRTVGQQRPASPSELRAAAWTVLALASDGDALTQPTLRAPYRVSWFAALRALRDAQDRKGRIGLDVTPDWPATLALAVSALAEACRHHPGDAALRDSVAAGLVALADHLRRVEAVSDEVAAWAAIAAHTAAPIAPEHAVAVREQVVRLAATDPAATPRSECLRLWAGVLTGRVDRAAEAARLAALLNHAAALFDDSETLALTVLLCYRAGGEPWRSIQPPLAVEVRRSTAEFTPKILESDDEPERRTRACRLVVAVQAYYRYCSLGLVAR